MNCATTERDQPWVTVQARPRLSILSEVMVRPSSFFSPPPIDPRTVCGFQ